MTFTTSGNQEYADQEISDIALKAPLAEIYRQPKMLEGHLDSRFQRKGHGTYQAKIWDKTHSVTTTICLPGYENQRIREDLEAVLFTSAQDKLIVSSRASPHLGILLPFAVDDLRSRMETIRSPCEDKNREFTLQARYTSQGGLYAANAHAFTNWPQPTDSTIAIDDMYSPSFVTGRIFTADPRSTRDLIALLQKVNTTIQKKH